MMESLEFFIDIIGRTMTMGSTQFFLWGKGGRCVGLTLPPSCPDCFEIWKPLNRLEPSGSAQACTGIALPLPRQLELSIQ